jgi:dGTPase
LLDKSKYEAQINDILKISISNIYESDEVISKEIAGYEILNTLLSARCNAITATPTHYDKLVLKLFKTRADGDYTLYQELLEICNQVSVMTDSKSVKIFEQLQGMNING